MISELSTTSIWQRRNQKMSDKLLPWFYENVIEQLKRPGGQPLRRHIFEDIIGRFVSQEPELRTFRETVQHIDYKSSSREEQGLITMREALTNGLIDLINWIEVPVVDQVELTPSTEMCGMENTDSKDNQEAWDSISNTNSNSDAQSDGGALIHNLRDTESAADSLSNGCMPSVKTEKINEQSKSTTSSPLLDDFLDYNIEKQDLHLAPAQDLQSNDATPSTKFEVRQSGNFQTAEAPSVDAMSKTSIKETDRKVSPTDELPWGEGNRSIFSDEDEYKYDKLDNVKSFYNKEIIAVTERSALEQFQELYGRFWEETLQSFLNDERDSGEGYIQYAMARTQWLMERCVVTDFRERSPAPQRGDFRGNDGQAK